MRTSQLLRLSAVHVAVALTLLPINSTLNRIMISELGISATLVALMIAVPYILSPMQMWVGSLSERYPLWGWRRTPYIILGLVLCAAGSALTPYAAFAIHDGVWWGLPLGFVAFGAWGFGFNFATVSYLSLATELSGAGQRARTVGVMWFVLILSMIIGGITLARSIEPYSHARLVAAFAVVAGIALTIGLVGLIGLEPRYTAAHGDQRKNIGATLQMVAHNPQARNFFVYLMLLLIALLGQDVLLEPYAADVFGVSPANTTRFTSIWGVALLVGLLVTNRLTLWYGLKRAAHIGATFAALGLLGIVLAGVLDQVGLLLPSLLLFGFGSGISTAANLALMLDMTIAGQVGLFIGAWGVADALARLGGTLLSGVVRDVVTFGTGNKLAGYATVFGIEFVFLLVSMVMLQRIRSDEFQAKAVEIIEVTANLS
ncbi:MAG: BCD family MFS transporter [Chloroflexales bacterium]|nr:BCD family MFS transporter [Chloroflexales bacterium]